MADIVGTTGDETLRGTATTENRIYGLAGNDSLLGGTLADMLDGGTGDDTLRGGEGNDTLVGGEGQDKLYGEGGADSVNGGQGSDWLNGGLGNDTYVLAVGDGVDQITDYDMTVGNVDRVSFTGVTSTALRGLERQGYNLVVKYGVSDEVLISNYFNTSFPGYKVEQFRFSDGVTWDEAGIKARVVTVGTAAGETITGYTDGTNRIYGLAGNDSLLGGALADMLDGGTGDDTLRGGEGNNTLVGGLGNDWLNGGSGNDTYRFSVGDGIDRIVDYDMTLAQTDVVQFTGVASTALRGVERQGKALVLKYGTSDQVILDDYFHATYPGYQTKQFVFSDAVTWGETEIKARVVTFGTNASDSLGGYTGGTNRIYGLDGHDILTGRELADVLDGGHGDDALYGGDGNDTLLAGEGNDSLYGGAGGDVLNGGRDIDLMKGGLGNDRYVVDNVGDVVTEYTNEGSDLVESSVTYTLSASVESLTLTRTSAINGTGNTLNNVLTGNSANNVLSGLAGDDSYHYSRGGGQDIVVDNAGTADRLQFSGAINPLDLVLSRQANDLRLAVHGSTDRVTIQNWYGGVTNQTETIQAGNGQTLLSTHVDQLIQAMASFGQQNGLTWDQAIDQRPQDVQAILAASWQ